MSAPDRTDVLVVGAGIAGSALAYELSRRGLHVTLLDKGADGPAGASTVPAALINPHRGRTARATAADLAGAVQFWRLVRELEAEVGSSGAHASGVLRVADNARQARAWQGLAGVEWLEPGEVPPEYHAPYGALVVPGGGWLRPRELLAALVRGAAAHGASVRWGTEFLGVTAAPSTAARQDSAALTARLRSSASEGESRLACRALVVATGAEQPTGLPLPRLELVWGEALVARIGVTPPLPVAGGVVAAFDAGLALVSGGHRPVGVRAETKSAGGRGGSLAGHTAEPEAGPPVARHDLLRALAWRVPAVAAAANATDKMVVSRWEGVRAKRASGEPVVRRLTPGVHLMLAFGGRGFLRAAAAAAALAERLAQQLR